jgi:hypothetical protein
VRGYPLEGEAVSIRTTDESNVMGVLEREREWKMVRFRCIFCGKEHDTVEECNGCEESH